MPEIFSFHNKPENNKTLFYLGYYIKNKAKLNF